MRSERTAGLNSKDEYYEAIRQDDDNTGCIERVDAYKIAVDGLKRDEFDINVNASLKLLQAGYWEPIRMQINQSKLKINGHKL